MTDEEKKAIKEIERELTDEDRKEYMSKWFALDLKILLNLIQKQKEEIEKKDRQIDLMAEYIDFDKMNFECSSLCVKDNCQKECIKEYFERKVENEN